MEVSVSPGKKGVTNKNAGVEYATDGRKSRKHNLILRELIQAWSFVLTETRLTINLQVKWQNPGE